MAVFAASFTWCEKSHSNTFFSTLFSLYIVIIFVLLLQLEFSFSCDNNNFSLGVIC